jgi:threonyl-tRNA synthetase
MEKVPYILVAGDKEVQQNAVAVRERGGKDLGVMPLAEFIDTVQKMVREKK